MTIHLSADVEQLLRSQMASGKYSSEDELLHQALLSLAEQEEDSQALDEAIAELKNGDPGIPLEESFERIRNKYQIPRQA